MINFYVMTLFPEMVENGLNVSILKRAKEAGRLGFEAINIRDYTLDKHMKVDDYPYSGGAGMLMNPDPIVRCHNAVMDKIPEERKGKVRTIYLSPAGRMFNQDMARDFAKSEDLIFICGHYEGIDQRAIDMVVTDEVSIGDYVLTGGELAAMVMIDSISRMVSGVLHNDVSAETETFSGNLLEYPQYTHPEIYEGRRVPPVLLSGNHKLIDEWKRTQSLVRTRERRPDLFEKVELSKQDKKLLKKYDEETGV